MGGFAASLPPDKSFDVVGMGLNAVDDILIVRRYPRFNSKVRVLSHHIQPGGQVATAMVALSRWGLRTRYIGKVGDDQRGRFLLQNISKEGVDIQYVTVEPGAYTQYAIIIVEKDSGERTILWDRDQRLLYRKGELSCEAVCSGRLLHLDGHDVLATHQAIQWAQQRGIPTVMDIDEVKEGTEEIIRDVDFLVASSEFPPQLTGIQRPARALEALAKRVKGFVAMTLGRDGVLAAGPHGLIHCAGFEVAAVDTTGAGDVFHAGFIFGLLSAWDLRKTLEFSNAVAALSCTKIGAWGGIPTLQEAFAFLAERFLHWKDHLAFST